MSALECVSRRMCIAEDVDLVVNFEKTSLTCGSRADGIRTRPRLKLKKNNPLIVAGVSPNGNSKV
eukprot:6195019-Pleurochrysis_carterae.AAC.2